MQRIIRVFRIAIACGSVLFAYFPCSTDAQTYSIPKTPPPERVAIRDEKIDPKLAAFIAIKSAQAEVLCKNANRPMPQVAQEFFAAAKRGDWLVASNADARISQIAYGRPSLDEESRNDVFRVRQPLIEIVGAWEQYRSWDSNFLKRFGREIIASIPSNNIYFGGTDPGRFLVTTMCDSHIDARPFFTLTQNALADGSYLAYLTNMYGGKIYIPDVSDSQSCFSEYLEDVKRRFLHDEQFPKEPKQVRPGEEPKIVNNQVTISGQVSVMAINALLVKVIFDKNPEREFYIEESFPLDWMYPYLTPHQFIMKLNRNPLNEILPTTLRADREFWTRQMNSWFGAWLATNTPVSQVTEFAQKVYLKNDFNGFGGDTRFIHDLEARKAFSKLRLSIGGVYAWRATNSKSSAERQRMKSEADFAFRQAFIICLISPEAVFRYVNLLTADARIEDALLVAITAHKLDIENTQLEDLVNQLLRTKKEADKAATSK